MGQQLVKNPRKKSLKKGFFGFPYLDILCRVRQLGWQVSFRQLTRVLQAYFASSDLKIYITKAIKNRVTDSRFLKTRNFEFLDYKSSIFGQKVFKISKSIQSNVKLSRELL